MGTPPTNVVVEVAKGLWRLLSEPISNIYNLADNLKLLEDERQRLMNMRDDVKLRVEHEEVTQQGQRKKEVDGWLNQVEKLGEKSHEVLLKGKSHQERKCRVWCCLTSSYKVGENVSQLRKDVKERQAEGKFDALVIRLPRKVREMPMEKAIGLDSMVSLVWEWLQLKDVGIIGLYGMGGVGKTSLLKKINEKFCHTSHDFQIVLWIVVSKQANLDKIREDIRNDLRMEDSVWSNQSEDARAAQICRVLNRKKFVLLIDDVWEPLDLNKIGIPFPTLENGSKIMFTTRAEQVCAKMKADKKVKVQCSSQKEALQLFKENVGEETLNLHREIPNCAIEIADECKGLPLALITIGRAMASMKTPNEWASALRLLRNYPSEFSEMVDDVYNKNYD